MTRKRAITVLDTNNDGTLQPTSVADYVAKNTSRRTHRVRTWDQANRGKGYYVPNAMREDVVVIRSFLVTHADENMTNMDVIAKAVIEHALEMVRKGELKINARPDPRRRNLTLMMVEGWPDSNEKKTASAPKQKKEKLKDLFICYRWGRSVDSQIAALSKEKAVPHGEIAVFLLRYAIDKFTARNMKFSVVQVTTAQEVSWPA